MESVTGDNRFGVPSGQWLKYIFFIIFEGYILLRLLLINFGGAVNTKLLQEQRKITYKKK
jgi:hypothetical protein